LKLSGNVLKIEEEEQCILSLIGRNQTNIDNIKFLTHYELTKEYDNILAHITFEPRKFMRQLREKEYTIIDSSIDEQGDIANFLFNIKNSNVKNSVNYLRRITSDVPTELRSIPKGDVIFIVRFYSAKMNIIKEEDADPIIDDGGMVIYEDSKYKHVILEDERSIEKYWSEDIYKAIFATKKMGFSLGLNDPDRKANMEILKEYSLDNQVFLFAKTPTDIDNLKNCNVVTITKRSIPNLKDILKKRFQKRDRKIQIQENINKKYLAGEKVYLEPDTIDPGIDTLKLGGR